jgi:hypothetical protein
MSTGLDSGAALSSIQASTTPAVVLQLLLDAIAASLRNRNYADAAMLVAAYSQIRGGQ